MTHTFIATWPITDNTIDPYQLRDQAAEELPRLAAQAHARIVSAGKWAIRPSVDVPGSGRVTEHVLTYTARAEEIDRRSYWKEAVA